MSSNVFNFVFQLIKYVLKDRFAQTIYIVFKKILKDQSGKQSQDVTF